MKALIELENIEDELYDKDRIAIKSEMIELLWKAVIESNRWKKWLLPDEKDWSFDEMNSERQTWLISTGMPLYMAES